MFRRTQSLTHQVVRCNTPYHSFGRFISILSTSPNPSRKALALHKTPTLQQNKLLPAKMGKDAANHTPLSRSTSSDPGSGYSGDDAWKYRAPYQIQTGEEFGPAEWHAKCHCGRVEYEIRKKKPLAVKFCHCRACQALHAAPFQWCAIFPKDDFRFIRGVDSLTFYSSHDMRKGYQVPCKVYCSYCNTPIMDEGRNVILVFPELIDLATTEEEQEKRRKAFEVDCHIFYNRRVVEILDGKPKWSELDNQSDLLDDHGHKL